MYIVECVLLKLPIHSSMCLRVPLKCHYNTLVSSQANQKTGHQKRRPSLPVLRPSASWYLIGFTETFFLSPSSFLCHTFLITVSVCVWIWVDDVDGLGSSVEDRSVYGVENSSMFLECSPKSQRALIYWQLQKPNDDRKHEVCISYIYVCYIILWDMIKKTKFVRNSWMIIKHTFELLHLFQTN